MPPQCILSTIQKPGGVVDQIFTYGAHLVLNEYDQYDMSLRSTVAWCLAHRPGERPTMLQLQAILNDAVRKQYPGEDNDGGRSTVADLLGSPPPPRPTVAAANAAALANLQTTTLGGPA